MVSSKKKLQTLQDRLLNVQRELDALKNFRQTTPVRRLTRELIGEYSFTKRQIDKIQSAGEARQRIRLERRVQANKNRSAKNKRGWGFIKNVQQNYAPDKSTKEVRSLYKKFRQGLETDIPDIAWRNPSP